MKRTVIRVFALLLALMLACAALSGMACFAEGEEAAAETAQSAEESSNGTTARAVAAAACIAVVAAVGAISMGFAISKATDGISRQPEADGKIRTALMLGLVFIETAVIYALIVAILIIFVL